MACRLIDALHYGRCQKKPEIPREPLCLPARVYSKLLRIKAAVLIVMAAVVMSGFLYLVHLEKAAQSAEADSASPPARQRQTDRNGPSPSQCALNLLLYGAAVFGAVYSISVIEKKTYAAMQDPARNPRGCKYQGRVLSTDDPHYLLHLNYYKTHNTWILPDEIEHGAEYP